MILEISFVILKLFLIVPSCTGTVSTHESLNADLGTRKHGGAYRYLPESHFSVIAPGLLKSNRKYTTVVSLHSANEPCLVNVSISGISFNASSHVFLQPFKSEIVDFHPPNIHHGTYYLKAECVEGCSFSEKRNLLTDRQSGPKIYIQTDKAVYKPQDKIQFRVLFLDEHTKPLRIVEPVKLQILDAKKNIVKTFKDIQFTKGVYINSFPLSERPVNGSWTIRVSVSGIYSYSRSKTIEIKKYVLPKFGVYIKTPKHVVVTDKYMKVIVYGKYTFGKYVQGVASVQLWNKFNNIMFHNKEIALKTLAGVQFPLEIINNFTTDDSFYVVVKVTENFTGITHSDSLQIMLHQQQYNIIANDEDFEFLGSELCRLTVYIQHWNGGPVADRKTAVDLIHGDKTYKSYMNENGSATFEFKNGQNSYLIYFKDSMLQIPNVYEARKEDESSVTYFKLKLLENRLRLGAPIKVLVNSSEEMPYLVYMVVGHGNIVRMQHIQLPARPRLYTIYLKPTIEMIPVSYLCIYYSSNDVFRSNELELVFPREFENKISLVAPKETQPGNELILEVSGQPQSIVALLAVDVGVHLMDPSYDLKRESIMDELLEDRSFLYSQALKTEEFLFSGLIILTNIARPIIEAKSKKPIRQSEGGPLRYRTQFPEVWIFQNIELNTTITKLSFRLPDAITTWRITAFSVNEKSGLGIVNGPTDVTAIKPFFISLNLPYSVKWGEIIAVPIIVFNYHAEGLASNITMINKEQEFEFLEMRPDGYERSTNQLQNTNQSVIPGNDGQLISFYIMPVKVGYINLRITASNHLFSDAVHQQLLVEPEGVSQKVNKAIFINSTDPSVTFSSVRIEVPPNVDTTTNDIFLSVGGDYIVPILDNLQTLVEMPTGCGEQNMVHFAPNVLTLEYLKSNGQYSKQRDLVATIKSYIEIGYQQQLSYRHENGGFSVFGPSVDDEASTWLTAYTVRFFIKASKFIGIEKRIIETGLKFLKDLQFDNGSFPYTGYLFDPVQQNQYALTAFILTAFLGDRAVARNYKRLIDKGLEFLTNNLSSIADAYELSIVAFVLQMAKNPEGTKVLEKLSHFRKEDSDLVWWSGNETIPENNVEITAYVLMAILDNSSTSDQLPVLKWLIKQRNEHGGFHSTQDTVVGLQALVKFNEKFADERNISLEITYLACNQQGEEVQQGVFKVERDNFMNNQKQELPKNAHNISFAASGNGSALVQLSHNYKLPDASTQKSVAASNDSTTNEIVKYFIIESQANVMRNGDLDLEICFISEAKTQMVLMEVSLLSGYRTYDETLADLQNNALVQRIEPKKDYTLIVVYLDKLPIHVESCINIAAYKISEIFERKPVPITMYDYYNLQCYNSTFYNI